MLICFLKSGFLNNKISKKGYRGGLDKDDMILKLG